MNKKFTKLIAAFALLVFMMPSLAGWGQETPVYTLTPANGSNNSYTGSCSILINSISWNLTGNSQVQPWRLGGGKTLTFNNADRALYSETAISNNIYKIEITQGTDAYITVNSMTVTIHTSADDAASGANAIATFTPTYAANSTITITKQNTDSWAGKFYRVVYNLTKTNNKNAGYVSFSEAKFYEESSGPTTTATTVTIDASGITNTNKFLGTDAGSFSATVTETSSGNTVSGATVSWESLNTDVATINSSTGAVTLVAAGTATIKASYAGNTTYGASNKNYTLNVTNKDPNAGISSNPYTVAQARQAIDDNYFPIEDAYARGIISQVDSYNSTYNSITYWISDDGTTTNQLEVYGGLNIEGQTPFSQMGDLQTGDIVVVKGTLQKYGTNPVVYEFNQNNRLISLERNPILTIASDVAMAWDATSKEISYTLQNPVTGGSLAVLENVDWISNAVLDTENSKVTLTTTQNTASEPRSGVITLTYTYGEGPTVISKNVTVTQAANYIVTLGDTYETLTEATAGAGVTLPTRNNSTYTFAGWSTTNVGGTETTTAPTTIIPAGSYSPSANTILYPVYTRSTSGTPTTAWQEITDLAISNLGEGVYALVAGDDKAFSGDISDEDNYLGYNGLKKGHGIATSEAFVFDETTHYATSAPSGTCEITFIEVKDNNNTVVGYQMYNESYGYLYAKAASSGNLDWHNTEDSYWKKYSDQNSNWTYNHNSAYLRSYTANTNIPTTFRTYGTNASGSQPLKLAKKVTVTPTVTYYTSLLSTYTLSINGYGNDNTVKTGWNLIASPVAVASPFAVNPSNVENMTSNTFDLYRFNGTATKEWENWKQTGDHYHFGLVPGKGYLYAHSGETVNLTFTGTMATSIADVNLPYNADSDIKSLYLAGNSLQAVTTFYVYDDQLNKKTVNFLTINGNGDGFITTPTAAFEAGAMQGFFVQSGGADWTLSTTDLDDAKSGNVELLNVKVSRNRGTLVDNAIVSFGNAQQMSKFYLFDNTTRVFIPQNGEEMAVVRSEAQGEMPVNFKANEDGQYTLTVNPENVEMNYLHLIDNMTGMNVDLLQTPSYSFNAKTTDYESRFRLVFAANNEDGVSTGSTTFAFISNGNIIVNGEGTLQVIDVTGRLLFTREVNSSLNTPHSSLTPGVYIIRLINGDNVRTQKIVIE